GLPQTPALGGLTSLDGARLSSTLDSTAKQGSHAAHETGGKVVGTTLPAAGLVRRVRALLGGGAERAAQARAVERGA
ncbi:hypothetical protein ACM9HC_33785, partial [Streptomyces sp. JAC18]